MVTVINSKTMLAGSARVEPDVSDTSTRYIVSMRRSNGLDTILYKGLEYKQAKQIARLLNKAK